MIRKLTRGSGVAFVALSGGAMALYGSYPNVAQIGHMADTAGQIDIAAGKHALAKSKNKAVRAFAEEMVRDHAAVNDQALALVKKLGVAPEANGTSAALSEEAKQQMRKLNGLDGAAFDKAYVQNEIAYHRTVNDTISGPLIPGAPNPEKTGKA